MYAVPERFRRKIKVEYPKHNFEIFEQWLASNCPQNTIREFLPIMFTSYHVNNRYGNDPKAMKDLQNFINTIDPSKKLYCALQYDSGPLVDLSRLDIKVFGSGGGRIDFPLPLICKPHGRQENERDIFANFIGSITHPIRKKMCESTKAYIKTDHQPIDQFCNILSRSVFTLCPRGYGLTSFRICEALEQGSIPVYISDQFIIPGNVDFSSYGVLIHSSRVEEIDHILASISPEEIAKKQVYGQMIYEKMYTFEGCRQLIIDNI